MYSPGPAGTRPATVAPLPGNQGFHSLLHPLHNAPPLPPPPDPFWQRQNIQAHLASLLENAALLKSIGDELEALQSLRSPQADSHDDKTGFVEPPGSETLMIDKTQETEYSSERNSASRGILRGILKESTKNWSEAASFGAQAAHHLLSITKAQLEPLQGVLDGTSGAEKILAAKRLGYKRNKVLRNRKWRTKKRQRVAKALRKERESFEEADREADEWRAREIAKVIAKRKMDKMKELAEKNLKEEKARRQEENEMILIIEKLQELRALRILKLKKQGHFFPDEDDQFVARVRAAVEEEERQTAAAVDTKAATAAIQIAEEARKAATIARENPELDGSQETQRVTELAAALNDATEVPDLVNDDSELVPQHNVPISEGQDKAQSKESERGSTNAYDVLPAEFYQYYYSSTFDMKTLIEVRQAWDAFIIPGGSRIPQRWIEAPPPADTVWASYLKQ